MSNNTSTFTPSTLIQEAAEQAQTLADTGKALTRFLPQEAQQAVEGVEKIAEAMNATGEALRQFGCDEAEPETEEDINADAIGNSDTTSIPPFPYWDVAEQTTETESVGYPKGLFPLSDFYDQPTNIDEQQIHQVETVTEFSFNNDDAADLDWFQMHHDDGIMDGYLDTAETANGVSMTTEPMTEFTIPEFTEFLPGQAIKLEESGMDGLVTACPFDAVTPNEPQNNDIF